MSKKSNIFLIIIVSFFVFLPLFSRGSENLYQKLSGNILLLVQQNGEAWYISPIDNKRHFLGRPSDAFNVMREQGVGITNKSLSNIPIFLNNLEGKDSDKDGLPDNFEDAIGTNKNNPDTDGDGYNDKQELEGNYDPNKAGGVKLEIDNGFSEKQKGKILLQVENNGEAWYVNPKNSKRYFLGNPKNAFSIMRELGLGISNLDFNELSIIINSNFICGNNITDIEGNVYGTVQIGDQCWMRKGIRSKHYSDGNSIVEIFADKIENGWSEDNGLYSCPVDKNESQEDCEVAESLGLLYQWSAAMKGDSEEGAQGICPVGWHVPSDKELYVLEKYLSEEKCEASRNYFRNNDAFCKPAGSKLSGNDSIDVKWEEGNLIKNKYFDSSDFNMAPSGIRNGENFYGRNFYGILWSSSQREDNENKAWSRKIAYNTSGINREDVAKKMGLSVRCVNDNKFIGNENCKKKSYRSCYNGDVYWYDSCKKREEKIIDCENVGCEKGKCLEIKEFKSCGDKVEDIEGNVYKTIKIGEQCWFQENMRTTVYPNGKSINKGPSEENNKKWNSDNAYFSCPPSKSNTSEDCEAGKSLGLLYQWSAAMNSSSEEGAQGICPVGWHIPTDSEWHKLESYLTEGVCDGNREGLGCYLSGAKLAGDINNINWIGNREETIKKHEEFNQSGFNAPASGYRSSRDGYYLSRSGYAGFWSSSITDSEAWKYGISYRRNGVYREKENKATGYSVRCIKN